MRRRGAESMSRKLSEASVFVRRYVRKRSTLLSSLAICRPSMSTHACRSCARIPSSCTCRPCQMMHATSLLMIKKGDAYVEDYSELRSSVKELPLHIIILKLTLLLVNKRCLYASLLTCWCLVTREVELAMAMCHLLMSW